MIALSKLKYDLHLKRKRQLCESNYRCLNSVTVMRTFDCVANTRGQDKGGSSSQEDQQ